MKTTGEIKDLLQKKELDSTLLDIYLDESLRRTLADYD